MLINISKFLSSDDISLKVKENFVIDDEEFLTRIHLKSVEFAGNFFKVDDNVLLTGDVEYTYEEECARCLTKFDNTVKTKFEAIVVKEADNNDESDEIKLVLKDGCVDLEEPVKQVIYLTMPMKAICKEDCKGICPTCGVNLNNDVCRCNNDLTDPRFDKLKDLLKD